MSLLEIFLIGISLSMDAFAISVCKGLSMGKVKYNKAIIIALYFGGFQALMPFIGYFLGSSFEHFITQIDHWITFILLTIIGGKMTAESFENNSTDDKTDVKSMIILAIATSIDALAIGITFAFMNVNILSSIFIIGIITFILCLLGVIIGSKFGNKFGQSAELIGGILLILIGGKILLEHLGYI